jgi:branched-chain amino acid transport system substrate-binding protein
VVADVIGRAEDLDDADAIAAAIKGTNMSTIVGGVDWSSGPVPNVSKTPLVSGQWQKAGDGVELVITNNSQAPDIPVGGELQLLG